MSQPSQIESTAMIASAIPELISKPFSAARGLRLRLGLDLAPGWGCPEACQSGS